MKKTGTDLHMPGWMIILFLAVGPGVAGAAKDFVGDYFGVRTR
ncbi:MAG: hypothetical protein NTZ78_00710 [Candidatus Aureabacteria bacterium]|nr:hypothetical protein [Candidatus Auribacterota bacterium]